MAQTRRQLANTSGGGGGNPSTPSQVRGVPENSVVQQIFGFDGLNYKAGRLHIGDQECLWCDNLHPIAPGNLRAMGDVGASIYDASPFTIVGQPQSYTLGATLYHAVQLSDGKLIQVLASSPYTTTQILPAGSLSANADLTQWGSQYLIIVSDVINGYWIWDGTIVYKSGSIGPRPNIEAGGVGYTSAPTITAIGGTGGGATFSSTIVNGSVTTITVTNSGTGWLSVDAPKVALLFDNGTTLRSARGHSAPQSGVIVDAVIDDGGTGYTSLPTITVTDGGGGAGSGANIVVNSVTNGQITGLKVIDGGTSYGTMGTVDLAFAGGAGSGATAHAVIANGVLQATTMDDGGTGYVDTPEVIFLAATGTGAQGTAILTGTTVTSVEITAGGSGYTGNVQVLFKAATGPAYATVELMPFGVNGISVATYQSRVWISHFPTPPLPASILFSDIDDPANFGPPGGAFPLTQEYLRYKLSHLVPSQSFLYLIGDSSIGYVSGVQTAGTPAITTFSVTNVSPQIGTPWTDGVYVFDQTILLVNPNGVYRITGGTVDKISLQIDDLFLSDMAHIGLSLPSLATGYLNSVHVFGVLWPVVDPTTNAQRRLVLMSDGKRWWTYSPSVSLQAIFTSEINSVLSLWGHDGTQIYPLAVVASPLLHKYWTKSYTNPSMTAEKRALAAYLFLTAQADVGFVIKPVTELGIGSAITPGFPTFHASGNPQWSRSGAQGAGHMLGWEITTTASAFTINEMIFLAQEFYNSFP